MRKMNIRAQQKHESKAYLKSFYCFILSVLSHIIIRGYMKIFKYIGLQQLVLSDINRILACERK